MIFRLTQKLAKKIGVPPLPGFSTGQNPFIDWTAHLFRVERVQYIIVTNTASLYSLVDYGRGITNSNEFIRSTLNFMAELMTNDGFEFIYRRLITPHTTRILFSKATDKRVLGSMNELIFQAGYYITERQMSPFDVSLQINETPKSLLGDHSTKDAFRHLKVEQ